MTEPKNDKYSLKFRLQARLATLFLSGFGRLSVRSASDFGGFIARYLIAPLPFSRRADENLKRVMPELDARQRRTIIRDMWEMLGRTAGELPHTKSMHIDGVGPVPIEVVGREIVERLRAEGKPILFPSAHQANWELLPLAARDLGAPLHVVYRAANNPLFDEAIAKFRGNITLSVVPKGASGARQLIGILKRGECIGMLIDQKMNDGISVPFFGEPAMTAPAIAQLARRQDIAIIPVQCERLPGPAFRITFNEPLSAKRSDDRDQDIREVMTELNQFIEGCIRQNPGQWLWLHRRWPKRKG